MVDCADVGDLLRANMLALGGESRIDPSATMSGTAVASAVGAGAHVAGAVERCVVFPGATVGAGERLADAVRWTGTDGRPATAVAAQGLDPSATSTS